LFLKPPGLFMIARKPGRQHLAQALVLLLFASMAWPVAGETTGGEVIQVYDVPRAKYAELRYLGDFWGINWREQYVSLHVTPRGRAAVEALGYRVETDQRKTNALHDFINVDRIAWREAGLKGIPNFPCYRTVDETHADLAALASDHPELARWEVIGPSWLKVNDQPGGNDIHVLVLGNQNSSNPQAPLMVMAAQHARELVTAESATRFAEWLINHYDQHPTARWLLDHREIHIIAQQNPDGRRAVENGQSMWRKNSNLTACPGGTPGVDLNRNSNYFWGTFSSTNTCNQIYHGTAPGSEPETVAVQNYMDQVFERHRTSMNEPVPEDASGLFLSLHSFGDMMLFPWEGLGIGASNDSPNHNQLAWLGRKLGYLTGYRVGRTILNPAGGTMTDYAHGEFGVAAYTYEIGSTFQQSCNSFETTLWPNVLDSLIYSAKAAELPYFAPRGPEVLDLMAVYDASNGQIEITGMADDTRFDRGGFQEAPAGDPIHEIAAIQASFGQPPHLSEEVHTLNFIDSGAIVMIDALINTDTFDPDQLLFLQATDSEGIAGVPDAVQVQRRVASISPDAFNLTLMAGQTGVETLLVSNIGDRLLEWDVLADSGRAALTECQPHLDEALNLEAFTLPDGATVVRTAVGGEDSQGQVVGFSFSGSVSGISGNATWASDMALTLTSPNGMNFSVGGYNTANPPWDFDGSGSNTDGSYSSSHVGPEVFGPNGTADAGNWQFDFEHTWNGTMNWSDLVLTLHKNEPPQCIDPEGVAWLQISQASGQTAPGEVSEIALSIDSSESAPGQHQALLCIETDDPTRELTVVEVNVNLVDSPKIFQDRFEQEN